MSKYARIVGGALLLLLWLPCDGGPSSASADSPGERGERIRRLLNLSGWTDRAVDGMTRPWQRAEERGEVPEDYVERLRRTVDREQVLALGVDLFGRSLSDGDLEQALAFYASPAGRALAGAEADSTLLLDPLLRRAGSKAGMDLVGRTTIEGTQGGSCEPVIAYNEDAALERLRRIAAAEESARSRTSIDRDADRVGEYATLQELAGAVPVPTGRPIAPRVLHPSFGAVDADGVARTCGYRFRVFLPDGAVPAGFHHERGPGAAVKGAVTADEIDGRERRWCAYAWPEKWGVTGRKVFFVDADGTVLSASNGTARWGGVNAPPADAAFQRADADGPVLGSGQRRLGERWVAVE